MRIIFIAILASTLINATIAPASQISETFDTASAAAGHGWVTVQNTTAGNSFGFSSTNNAAGVAGEAGGVFSRNLPATKGYYADTTLGGTFTLNDSLSASGLIKFTDTANADLGIVVGYISTTGYAASNANILGLQLSETPSPNTATHVRINAQFGLADGGLNSSDDDTAVPWASIAKFDFAYNPTANSGNGELIAHVLDASNNILATRIMDLTAGQRSIGGSFDAFGLSQIGMPTEGAQTMTFFADNLNYTVLPEPSSATLLIIGAVLIVIWRLLGRS